MMKRLFSLLICSSLSWAFGAHADTWLPPEPVLVHAIESSPGWQAQLAQVQAMQARADQIRHIDKEWSTQASYGQRRNRAPWSDPAEARTREWSLGIQKETRWLGQGRAAEHASDLAGQLGEKQLEQAWLGQVKELLSLHQNWLSAVMIERSWSRQMGITQQQLDGLGKRQTLGDAPRVDVMLMEATLAQTQAKQAEARQQVRQASSLLRARFPNWPQTPPADDASLMETSPPTPSQASLDTWIEQHPDVQLAHAQALFQEANTQQVQAESRPAPTVGLNWAHDNSGRERTWTVSVSVPLGGAYRQAASRAAAQDEASAQARYQQVVQDVRQALETERTALSSGYEQWNQESLAHARLQAVVQSQSKGVALGETSVPDLLVTQRQAAQQEADLVQRFFQLKSQQWNWLADTQNPWKRVQPSTAN